MQRGHQNCNLSVTAPRFNGFRITLAPIKGSPNLVSVTLPLILKVPCPRIKLGIRTRKNRDSNAFLIDCPFDLWINKVALRQVKENYNCRDGSCKEFPLKC